MEEVLLDLDPSLLRKKELAEKMRWSRRLQRAEARDIRPFSMCGARVVTWGKDGILLAPLHSANWRDRQYVAFNSAFAEALRRVLTAFPVGNESVRTIGLDAIGL